jgi:hypothetical protein
LPVTTKTRSSELVFFCRKRFGRFTLNNCKGHPLEVARYGNIDIIMKDLKL